MMVSEELMQKARNLSGKETTWERQRREEEEKGVVFNKLLEVVDNYVGHYKLKVIRQTLKKATTPGRGSHQRFVNVMEKKVDDLIWEQEDHERWMQGLLSRFNED